MIVRSSRLLAGCSTAATDLLGLLGQKNGLNIRQNTTLGDGDSGQQLVQFLVVADGQLQMTRNDTGLLVVTSSVAGQLENFGSQVLHDGSQVDRGAGTNALGVVAFAEQTVDTTDWKLQTGAARSALCLSLDFASFSSSRHDDILFVSDRNEIMKILTDRCYLFSRQQSTIGPRELIMLAATCAYKQAHVTD